MTKTTQILSRFVAAFKEAQTVFKNHTGTKEGMYRMRLLWERFQAGIKHSDSAIDQTGITALKLASELVAFVDKNTDDKSVRFSAYVKDSRCKKCICGAGKQLRIDRPVIPMISLKDEE